MIKKSIILFTIILLFLVSLLLFLPFAPEKISNFLYRELSYNKIAKLYKGNSYEESIQNLFLYVSEEQSELSNKYLLVDKNSFNDLIRGVGACDQQAFTMMTLLEKLNISNTRLRDVQAHTYSEVLLDGKWVIVDPFFSFYPQDYNNNYFSLDDLKDLEISNKNIKNLNFLDTQFRKNIKNIYLENDVRWDDGVGSKFLDYRAYDFYRTIIANFADYSYFLLGDLYLNWVQNLHLRSSKVSLMIDKGEVWIPNYIDNYENNDEAFQLFYKARNYDILKRLYLAKKYYLQILNYHPSSYWAIESKYYLSKLKSN